jgi:hypothetical protein
MEVVGGRMSEICVNNSLVKGDLKVKTPVAVRG